MRMLLRKALPVLLALCMIFSAFPAVSYAAEEAPKFAVSGTLSDELPIIPPYTGDASYSVEYYQQDLEGDGYTLYEAVTLNAKAGTSVDAEDKDYPGFALNTEKSDMSGTVADDGSTVLKLYYDRNLYTVTWKIGQNETNETYRYLATPTFKGSTNRADGEHGSNFVFIGWDKAPSPVTKDVTYKALYNVDCEAFILNDDSWATLQLALTHAKTGDTIRIEKDLIISEDIVIPAGVTLLLPCMDNDKGYIKRGEYLMNPDGTDTSGQGIGPNAKCYRTVTVAENATVTVYGSVMVNAVTGRKATANSDQDVTGGYAVLELQGKVDVEDGGHLDAFGFVRGSGVVTAKTGGTVGDLYVVRHWRGGTHAYNMYNAGIYPMNEYDCHNIEAMLRIEYGGSLEGIVKMYAAGSYNRTRFPQVDNRNGLIRLTDPMSVLVRTVADGREHFEICGGADFSNSTLKILGYPLTTADYIYPIDGDIDFALNDGAYRFANDFKFLPGAIVKVNPGAALTVDARSMVVFYQKFDNGDFSDSSRYPERRPAQLRVAEGARFTNQGIFAGDIYTESPDILIGTDPVWEALTYEAKCLTGGTPPEVYTIPLKHTLSITRPHYRWEFGEDKSIVWNVALANYSAVEAAVAMVPKELNLYTDESVQALNEALAAVEEGLFVEEQAQVDAWAEAIVAAVNALAFKPADYSEVETAIAAVPADLTLYTEESVQALNAAIAAVESGLLITEQAQVDAWAKAINDALFALAPKEGTLANYSAVNAALAQVPSDLTIYTDASREALENAIKAVHPGLFEEEQAQVDAWANAIIEAIAALTYKPADYSRVEAAIAMIPEDLSAYTTQSVQALNAALAAVKSGLLMDEQEQVDAWADAIAAAIIGLTKKCDGGKACPGKKYVDMPPANHWSHEGIDFAITHDLFNGISETVFAPNETMTRAMLVTVLWRLAGKPKEGKNTFTDVKNGAWYSDAVAWAAENHVVNGVANGKFAPDAPVTREQLAAILYRYVGKPDSNADLSGFADQNKVSNYARDAISWAVGVGIIQGARGSAGKLWLNPQSGATRAEVATMIMRFAIKLT